jgi:hypothetical protein
MTGGRRISNKTALAVLLLGWIGNKSVLSYQQVREGSLIKGEACAPSRRKIRVDEIALVCDDGSGYEAYTNRLTCRPGDRAKVAVDCTYQY